MALSSLDDKDSKPSQKQLAKVLGPTASLWKQLIRLIRKSNSPIEEVWNFGGAKYGWSMRLKRKDRTVLYLIPQSDQFLVGIVLGEKAVKAVHEAGATAQVLALLDNAPRYAEGRGIRFPVKTDEDLKIVEQLAAAKMSR